MPRFGTDKATPALGFQSPRQLTETPGLQPSVQHRPTAISFLPHSETYLPLPDLLQWLSPVSSHALGGSDGKESACNVGDLGSIPGLGRFPWRREWQPTPASLPREFHGQRSLAGYSLWGPKESDMTESPALSFFSLVTPIHLCSAPEKYWSYVSWDLRGSLVTRDFIVK